MANGANPAGELQEPEHPNLRTSAPSDASSRARLARPSAYNTETRSGFNLVFHPGPSSLWKASSPTCGGRRAAGLTGGHGVIPMATAWEAAEAEL